MTESDFREGRLYYTAEEMDKSAAAFVLGETWQDGYLAFSTGEIRLADLPQAKLKDIADGRMFDIRDGLSGYLMEAGLWRREANGGRFVEVCLEREDDRYYVQRWELDPHSPDVGNCYWRGQENLLAQNRLIFNQGLDAVEVIVPECRLHFFITTGGKHHAETAD